jgi:hypothetical protein
MSSDVWRRERHFRKRNSGHVFYVHTKIMAADLLSDDPPPRRSQSGSLFAARRAGCRGRGQIVP